MRTVAAVVLAALGALTGCQPEARAPAGQGSGGKSTALLNMERVAIAAHRCWFAGNDPAFRDYSFANELNNFSGRPRFLVVPRGNYGGRPLLVVQAEGPAGRVSTFGPLLDGPEGTRIAADIARWAAGAGECAARA